MDENSITTIARHEVLEGEEEHFLSWVEKTKIACKNYSGYLGTKVSPPIDKNHREFVTIFRFDNLENLDRWLNSETRKVLLKELTPLIKGEITLSKISGIDYYFESTQRSLSLPIMTIITYIGLMPLVIFVPPLFQKYLNHQGTYLAFTATALIVVLMSYLVMPFLVKITYFGIQLYENLCKTKK